MTARFGDGRDWFFEKRFGMFIHWGLYAIPAWHEQVLFRRPMDHVEYEKLIDRFNPVRFDPDEWIDVAEDAGMEFLCFTTKHVDGFCLFDTAQHEHKITNTPYGKDVLAQLAEACHRRDFPLCLYYAVPDMYQRNYAHVGRSYEYKEPPEGFEPDFEKYLAFVRAQMRELCENYGEIHGFWWDANHTGHEDRSFNDTIRELQPNAVISPRGFDEGDHDIWERAYKDEETRAIRVFERPTQACQPLGRESWGYREDEDYHTVRYVMQRIDGMMAKGANYLLNVGPMADGRISEREQAKLREIGGWYDRVREAFGDAEPASLMTENADVLLTRRGNTLYVHLPTEPTEESVVLPPLETRPLRATLLNNGQELETRNDMLPRHYAARKGYLRVRGLPCREMSNEVMVIKLEFDGEVGG